MRGKILLCGIGVLLCTASVTRGQISPVEPRDQRKVSAKDVTATIIGDASICEGDSSLAYIYMTGTAPWDVEVSDSDTVYARLEGITSPHALWLKPKQQQVYEVTAVADGDGDTGSTFGQASVIVNNPTPVNILLERLTYLSSEAGVELRADHEPGVFSGPGVSGGFFYPSIAGPVRISTYHFLCLRKSPGLYQ